MLINLRRLPAVTGCLLYCCVHLHLFDPNLIFHRNSDYLVSKERNIQRKVC